MTPLPPRLADHFRSPRHLGDPTGADGRGRTANEACGDEVELGLWVEEGRVARALFRARACSATVAVASLVCERLQGTALEEVAALDLRAVLAKAGGLPARKRHALGLVERALAQALREVRARYP